MAATITVVCPYCKSRMRASSEHIGRKGRCTVCKKLVDIRASDVDEHLLTIRPTGPATVRRETDVRLSSTGVPGWHAGVLGAVATAAIYLLIFAVARNSYVGQLFLERGPMQYATTLVTCWALALLALKYRAVRSQKSYAGQELELIPLEIGVQITPSNVDQFLGHLDTIPRTQRLSILGHRIQGALEHFKSRNSVPEVQQFLTTQAELDASAVDSGYTLLRAFIWVIPLLGFIGTVTGISAAVGGLDQSLRSGGGTELLMTGLSQVTAGLAIAFDTTFLALVMAIILVFPTEALRKTEYAMLDRIEAFANESVLRRLNDEQGPVAAEELPEIVRVTLDGAFREHQRWLAQWQAQVAQLGESVGRDFEAVARRLQEEAAQAEAARLAEYRRLAELLQGTFAKGEQAASGFQEFRDAATAQTREFMALLTQAQQALAENGRRWKEILDQQAQAASSVGRGDLGHALAELTAGIGKLIERLDAPQTSRAGSRPGEMGVLEPLTGEERQPAAPPGPPPWRSLWSRIFYRS